MIREPVTISVETYTTVVEKENLGEAHVTLLGERRWHSPEAERSRSMRVLEELRAQGLRSGSRVSDAFYDTLMMLQRPAVEYYCLVSLGERATTVRTVMTGRDALLIENQGASLTISPIPREQLGVRLAAALPETPAARLQSMNCHSDELELAKKGANVPSTPSGRDAKRMYRTLQGSTDSGELYAAVRDGITRRKATRSPVPCWIDTESGRVLVSQDAGGWFTLVSADMMAIANKLNELGNSLGTSS